MNFKINGELKKIKIEREEATLSFLISKLELNPKLIVVEFNGAIINSDNWETQSINDGDTLEIVTIVGGG